MRSKRHGSEMVLVADDDSIVRSVLAEMLARDGYRVIACANGEEALAEFSRAPQTIKLVISDAVMPHMGGRDLHREITASFGEVPFLICSAYTADTFESGFFDHPMRRFLAKPFNSQELYRAVRTLINAGRDFAAQRQA